MASFNSNLQKASKSDAMVQRWELDSEDGAEWSGRGLLEGTPETHLRVGKAQGYPRSYPIESLALARDSL